MNTRKNAADLAASEREDFIERLLLLKNTPSPEDPNINIYDQYVAIHRYVRAIDPPGRRDNVDMGHGNAAFLPWHRYYLLRFEQALQAMKPDIPFALPYWDWTNRQATVNRIFQPEFMGPNGGATRTGGTIQSGYFRFDVPERDRPSWWPAGLPGWRIRPSLSGGRGTALVRGIRDFSRGLPGSREVNSVLSVDDFSIFVGRLEGRINQSLEPSNRMHNQAHVWFGGTAHMRDSNVSPNDPMFWLHHCNVDRLWALWQVDGHSGSEFYPGPGTALPPGHDEDDRMWPWVGNRSNYRSNNRLPGITLPDFTRDPVITPADVLDHRALGYSYDTEVNVSSMIGSSRSMAGLTSLSTTGSGDLSMSEAARAGVLALLNDCKAAYQARRAYVFAEMKTSPAHAAPAALAPTTASSYQLIKDGNACYATAEASVTGWTDSDLRGAQPPQGKLSDAAMHFLAISAHGAEQSSLQTQALVGQGYHGESPAAVNKYMTDAFAAVLKYGPVIELNAELFAGEQLHIPFNVTDADESFMITVQCFDCDDQHWDLCLMTPAGEHCLDTRSEHSDKGGHHGRQTQHDAACAVTLRREHGRFTVFLERGAADSGEWVGVWCLMGYYSTGPKEDGAIQMPDIGDMLVPAGSPPLTGPVYARYNQPPGQRQALRTLPGGVRHELAPGISGISGVKTTAACAVAVNIYARSLIKVTLEAEMTSPCAGTDFRLRLRFSDSSGGGIEEPVVTARLIAPAHSIGNAFADLETIPVKAREKYLSQADGGAPVFNQPRYLADYEMKRPGVFAIRDEVLQFSREPDGSYYAMVSGNRYPGVYRVAAYVGAHLSPAARLVEASGRSLPSQTFERVIAIKQTLGLRLDAQASRPVLYWLARDRCIVSVTPTDHLGNIADPAYAAQTHVLHGPQRLRGLLRNPYTGECQVELRLAGENVAPAPDGQTITGTAARLELESGGSINIIPGDALNFTIAVAGTVLAVRIPPLVGDCDKQRAYGAGTTEAMCIPLACRKPFFSKEEARAAGYTC